jgi:hypothetical protein
VALMGRRNPQLHDLLSKNLQRPEVQALCDERPYLDPAPAYGMPSGGSGSPLEENEGCKAHLDLKVMSLVHTHVANERLPSGMMKRLRDQGLQHGWPDYNIVICFQWPDLAGNLIWRPGFYIELKRLTDWKVSRNQAKCIRDLRRAGAIAELAWGAEHLLAIVRGCLRRR